MQTRLFTTSGNKVQLKRVGVPGAVETRRIHGGSEAFQLHFVTAGGDEWSLLERKYFKALGLGS